MTSITERFQDSGNGKPPVTNQRIAVDILREPIHKLAEAIDAHVPHGRNQSLALTALEDVQMRANRGIFQDWTEDHVADFTEPADGDDGGLRYIFDVEDIARICHDADRALQIALGEAPNNDWANTSADIKESVVTGVIAATQEGMTPAKLHRAWVLERTKSGYVYGEVKDHDKKTHPCLVPYEDLPSEQRAKDVLFFSIVLALTN